MNRIGLRFAVVSIALVLFLFPSSGQVKFQVGAGGGVLLPMGDYAGETTEYYAGTKYGLSTGYTLQGKARVGIAGFTLVGGVNYSHLSNSGEGVVGRGSVDVSQSILTFKVGPEFTIPIPAAPVTPYLGGNVAFHSISGKTKFQGLTAVPSSEFDVEGATRIGFGLNAGVVISLGGLNLDLGAEYAFVNPISKEWKSPTNANRVDSYKSLNDEKDPLFNASSTDHFVGSTRSISTFAITATLMFGI